MTKSKNWIWILFFGSLWGMSEVWGGEILFSNDVPHASFWLSAFAVFLLAAARGLMNAPGTSTAVATIATLFKLTNASPYFCHLLAIFLFGAFFDLTASWLLRKENLSLARKSLTGVLGVLSGFTGFALIISYVVRYRPWVEGGLPKIINYIFISGVLTALAAGILFPLGFRAGEDAEKVSLKKPGWSTAGAAFVVIVLWALGRFVK